jgi:phage RecT family recombinase
MANNKAMTLRGALEGRSLDLTNAIPKMAQKYLTAEFLIGGIFAAGAAKPEILQCKPISLINCAMQAASMGIPIGGSRGGHIIPFKGEAKFIPGYKALTDLIYRAPNVKKIVARAVYRNEECKVEYGTVDSITHTPILEKGKRGDLKAAYATAHLDGVDPLFVFLTLDDINDARAQSQMKDGKAWKNHTAAMARKTALLRLFPLLPHIQEDIAMAVDAVGKAEFGPAFDAELTPQDDGSFADTGSAEEEIQKRGRGQQKKEEAGGVNPLLETQNKIAEAWDATGSVDEVMIIVDSAAKANPDYAAVIRQEGEKFRAEKAG